MGRYIDLTGMIENGLWGYYQLPGLENIIPHVKIEHVANVKEDDFFASTIYLSTVTGTYLEAGSHILEDGKTLDQYTVTDFIKPVKVIRLPEQKAKSLIDAQLLEDNAPEIEKGEALVFDTGWGKRWNKPGYVLECPNYRSDAMEWILEKKPSILGFDVPCLESSWSEEDDESKGGILGEMFRHDVLMVAPLVNMDQIRGKRGTLFCLPMLVKGTSGAPVRVVYQED